MSVREHLSGDDAAAVPPPPSGYAPLRAQAHDRPAAVRHAAFRTSALTAGLAGRLAIAVAAVALLWLTVGWALA